MKNEIIRYGSFGPMVWNTVTATSRCPTSDDLNDLPMGDDLTEDEEAAIDADNE